MSGITLLLLACSEQVDSESHTLEVSVENGCETVGRELSCTVTVKRAGEHVGGHISAYTNLDGLVDAGDVVAGKDYTVSASLRGSEDRVFWVVAVDAEGNAGTAVASVLVDEPDPPGVDVSSPVDGASYSAQEPILLKADIGAPNGSAYAVWADAASGPLPCLESVDTPESGAKSCEYESNHKSTWAAWTLLPVGTHLLLLHVWGDIGEGSTWVQEVTVE